MCAEDFPQRVTPLINDLIQQLFGGDYAYGSVCLAIKNRNSDDVDLNIHIKKKELADRRDDTQNENTRKTEDSSLTPPELIEQIAERLCVRYHFTTGEIGIHVVNSSLSYVAITIFLSEEELDEISWQDYSQLEAVAT